MRDVEHYRRMLNRNPDATVGTSLAAAAVYASRYGTCEAEDRDSDAWRAIFLDLRARYGDTLTASEVEREAGMVAPCRN